MKTRVIKENFSDGRDFSVQHKELEGDISVHWHHFYEFDILLSGAGETVVNGQSYPMERGMISLLSPMDFHAYRITQTSWMINVQFREQEIDCELLNRFLSLKNRIIFADGKALGNMEALVGLVEKADYHRQLIECMVLEFLACSKPEGEKEVRTTSLQRAMVYINAHFAENPSMKLVADLFYLNPSYFSRMFRQQMGMTYKDYLRQLKLGYSRKLIQYTDLTMLEIAIRCGYENQTHFNRDYKNFYGEAPSVLRKTG